MTDELKKEFTLRISQANSTDLIVILYDMILVYLDEAIKSSKKEDLYKKSIQKIRDCIGELMESLNLDYEMARNMYSLYVFFLKELVQAEKLPQGVEKLEGLKSMIESLRNAYKEVALQDNSAPLMQNTQTVYAGLTYGKKDVNVNLGQLSNRGFRA